MYLRFDEKENPLKLPRAAAGADADEQDLRVLLFLALCEADGEDFDSQKAQDILGISETDVKSSLKFWRGAGVISRASRKKLSDNSAESPANSGKKAKQAADTERGDKKCDEREVANTKKTLREKRTAKYTAAELCKIAQANEEFKILLDMAQQTAGHIFNTPDIEIITGLYSHLSLAPEYILTLLNYFVKRKEKNLRYAEKAAYSFVDEGIDTPHALEERLKVLEREEQNEGKIRVMFGIGTRKLTDKEREYLKNWYEIYKFNETMIALAYEKTVNATGKASLSYANGILKKWHAEGKTTPEETEKPKKTSAKAGKTFRTFDVDEFFEKALKRSYGDGGGEKQ